MSFEANEIGIATGKPIRLYLFERGQLKWRYCDADRDIEYDGATWLNQPISADGFRQSGEPSADAVKIRAPADLAVAAQYRIVAPSAEIALTVIDLHYGDILGRVRWVGSMSDVSWLGQHVCEITCQSLSASMERTGLRLSYCVLCPHTLYDRNCGVGMNAFKLDVTVQSLETETVTATGLASYANDYFSGGFIEWNIGSGELERRGINTHTGSTLLLLGLSVGITAGMVISVFPGCRFTPADCNDKFSNIENYGGIIHLPGVSPFDGNPIY